MKKVFARVASFALIASLALPGISSAQGGNGEVKEQKEQKEQKEIKEQKEQKEIREDNRREKKATQEIVITTNGDKKESMIIVVDGDKITVNGKDASQDHDVSVTRRNVRDRGASVYSISGGNADDAPNTAMLGVSTRPDDAGARIASVTEKSGAEKAGLKEEDVITKIDSKTIASTDDVSAAIRAHKVGDRVDITYLRDGKEAKVTATLGKWEGMSVQGFGSFNNLNYNFDKIQTEPLKLEMFRNQLNWNSSGGAPKLGLSVQDTDDGKGVKVLDVSDEGNAAKAGIEEEDVITEVDGKEVNSADEIAKIVRESKDKTSLKFKLTRDNKSKTVDVRVPRKLKTASL